jgi:hypothetical protein
MIHGSILTAHERSPLRANIKTVRPGIFGDQNMTESANESLPLKDSLEAAQQELWRWAGVQVVPWGELQTDDYDFRTWARNGSDKLLEVGCFYEFARESHQFRCLIVLWREVLRWKYDSTVRLPASFWKLPDDLRQEYFDSIESYTQEVHPT